MRKLYIGECFSDDPSGRYYTDGDGNGEEFREEILKPLLKSLNHLIVNISRNVEGYGSSFLVESFGGLIKHGYFSKDEVLSKLTIENESEDYEFYKKKIFQYINEANYDSEKYISSKSKALKNGDYENLIDKSFVQKWIDGR